MAKLQVFWTFVTHQKNAPTAASCRGARGRLHHSAEDISRSSRRPVCVRPPPCIGAEAKPMDFRVKFIKTSFACWLLSSKKLKDWRIKLPIQGWECHGASYRDELKHGGKNENLSRSLTIVSSMLCASPVIFWTHRSPSHLILPGNAGICGSHELLLRQWWPDFA